MKLTSWVPTTEQNQDMVCAQVRRLFQVNPSIVRRSPELQIDLDILSTGEIPPLVGQIPYVVVTLGDPGCLTREQRKSGEYARLRGQTRIRASRSALRTDRGQ